MQQLSKEMGIPAMTIGLDVGDRRSIFVVLDGQGKVTDTGRVDTTPEAIAAWAASLPQCRIAFEAGTHAAWLGRSIDDYGHDVVVANPRRLKLISQDTRKSDLSDAENLARLARCDVSLLRPVTPRQPATQRALSLLRARDALVGSRSKLIHAVRGGVKSHGVRIPSCSAEYFHRHAPAALPADLLDVFRPLIETVAEMTVRIRAYDRQIEEVAQRDFPQAQALRQIKGVGPLTSLAFVLIVEDPKRFRKSRDVAAYIGLVPKRRQSGDSDPQLRISKTGDKLLRRLLVTSAQYMLGPFGQCHDSDLKRFGERIAARGGKAAKKRAVVAVARKLAVVMHRLWVTGEAYDPDYNRPSAA